MTSYILETGSLAEVWSSLPYGSKELLHDDSNQVVNFDGILTFYDSEHIRALSSRSYSPEATAVLFYYYEEKNERIASNLIFYLIFLKYANMCNKNGQPVDFATAVAHFRSLATKVKKELMAKRFLESSGSLSSTIKNDATTIVDTLKEEGVDFDFSHDEVMYALGITMDDSAARKAEFMLTTEGCVRLLSVILPDDSKASNLSFICQRIVEKTMSNMTVDADMYQIDQDEVYELTVSKHLPSFLKAYQTACSYQKKVALDGMNKKTLSFRALDEDDNWYPLSNDTTYRSNEVNSEIVSFKYQREGKILAGEWYGESLLIYTPPTQQQMNLKMTAMRHALCTITIFVCLLFYIKKSRQVFLADLQHKKKRK